MQAHTVFKPIIGTFQKFDAKKVTYTEKHFKKTPWQYF